MWPRPGIPRRRHGLSSVGKLGGVSFSNSKRGACFVSSMGVRPCPMLEDGGIVSVWVATKMGVSEVEGVSELDESIVLLLGFLARLTICLSKVLRLGLFLVTAFTLRSGFG